MNSSDILNMYIPIVKFLKELLGEGSHVKLFDVRKSDPIVMVSCEDKTGGNDFGHCIYEFEINKKINSVLNSKNFIIKDSNKVVRYSNFYIKDFSDEVIGMICISYDLTLLRDFEERFGRLLLGNDDSKNLINENKEKSMYEIMLMIVLETKNKFEKKPSEMSMDEKKWFVLELKSKGIFLLKGSINIVADIMEVSEQTIYRYLQEIED